MPFQRKRSLNSRRKLSYLGDFRLIALIESPFLDPLAANQAGLRKNAQMLAGCGLGDAQFPCDKDRAHAVFHQIAIHLGREVPGGAFEPLQYLQPPVIGKCA